MLSNNTDELQHLKKKFVCLFEMSCCLATRNPEHTNRAGVLQAPSAFARFPPRTVPDRAAVSGALRSPLASVPFRSRLDRRFAEATPPAAWCRRSAIANTRVNSTYCSNEVGVEAMVWVVPIWQKYFFKPGIVFYARDLSASVFFSAKIFSLETLFSENRDKKKPESFPCTASVVTSRKGHKRTTRAKQNVIEFIASSRTEVASGLREFISKGDKFSTVCA